MKKHSLCLLVLLLCLTSFALECTCGNGALLLRWAGDGVLQVFLPDNNAPLLEISPKLTGEVQAELIPRGYCDVLSLRSADGSLGIKLDKALPSFTLSVNRNASPVDIRWNPQAVVLPDIFAEDVILEASDKTHELPAFLPLYMGLIQGENATVAIIPYQARQDAVLSADLKTLSLYQENQQDYRFLVNAATGAWHQSLVPDTIGETRTDDSWTAPYPAVWMASFPMERDFLASGDGSRANWRVLTVAPRPEDGKLVVLDPGQRVCMTNISSRQTWLGGFEGNFHHPVEFQDGKAVLHNTLFQTRDRVKTSTVEPVYFYAYQRGNRTPPELTLPWDVLPPWRLAFLYGTNTIGSNPATCDVTNEVETIFYKDESSEKSEYIHQRLVSMQFFVEGIRGRIEDARRWKDDLLADAAKACAMDSSLEPEASLLKEILSDVERLYGEARPVIQTPDVVWEYSQEIDRLANSELDAEEKEDRAKELGRKIRTIGGGQDNLNAKMRHIGKNLRFQALNRYMTSSTPEAKAFWKNIYCQTEPLFQGYFGHDGK